MKLTVTLVEARGLPLSTGRKPPHSYALLRARAEARPWSFERTRTVYSSRSPRWAKAVQVEVPAMAQFIEGEVSIVAASSREGDEPLATAKFTIAPVAERGARDDAGAAIDCWLPLDAPHRAPRRERPKPMWNGPRAPPSAAAGRARRAAGGAAASSERVELRVMLKFDDGAAPPRLADRVRFVSQLRAGARAAPGGGAAREPGTRGAAPAIISGLLRRAFVAVERCASRRAAAHPQRASPPAGLGLEDVLAFLSFAGEACAPRHVSRALGDVVRPAMSADGDGDGDWRVRCDSGEQFARVVFAVVDARSSAAWRESLRERAEHAMGWYLASGERRALLLRALAAESWPWSDADALAASLSRLAWCLAERGCAHPSRVEVVRLLGVVLRAPTGRARQNALLAGCAWWARDLATAELRAAVGMFARLAESGRRAEPNDHTLETLLRAAAREVAHGGRIACEQAALFGAFCGQQWSAADMAVAAAVMTSQGAAARAVESADAPRTRSLDLSEFCALCGAWLREARLDERTLSERVDGFVAHARSSRERSLLLHSVAITALTCTGDGAIIRLARALDGAVPATACDELSGALSSLPSEAAQVQRCLLVGFCMRLAEPLDDRVLARTCKELLLDWRKDPK